MTIKTKFDIGARLWPILGGIGTSAVHAPFDLQFIVFDGKEVTYGFTRDYGFAEFCVFDIKADADAECARRNAK